MDIQYSGKLNLTHSLYYVELSRHIYTECPKSNRKSVLHLPRYIKFSVYLSRCSTDLRLILGHSVYISLITPHVNVIKLQNYKLKLQK